jgi:hypothetical protein
MLESQGSVIKEQGVTFAVVLAKRNAIDNRFKASTRMPGRCVSG